MVQRVVLQLAALTLILSVTGVAHAQSVLPGASLYAVPPTPSPGTQVTITATGFSFDRETLRFDWTINGKVLPELSGVGKYSVTVNAGAVGEDINVRARVSDGGSTVGTLAINVPIADLSLVQFAETYVPKWYKGRALPIPGSTVTIVAMPEIEIGGRLAKPENLFYSWSVDNREEVQKGVGAQTLRLALAATGRKEYRVRVRVEDVARTIKKEGMVFIRPTTPRAVLYAHTPLGGIEYRNALSTLVSSRRGLFDFIVEPFFFSIAAKNALSYGWSVANEPSEGNPKNPDLLTIDVDPKSAGEAEINVTVSDPRNEFLSSASDALRLILQ